MTARTLAEAPRPVTPGPARPSVTPMALWVAAGLGAVHGLVSLYWMLGGQWLLGTVGPDVADLFRGNAWMLLPVVVLKLGMAAAPPWLHARGWPTPPLTRSLCWLAAAVLVVWGGANVVVGNLALLHVLTPAGPVDRLALIGHAWLWDPLFLAWGIALAVGLARRQVRSS